ncbi:MAG TPA: c-type cytochrome [Candidatus Acidoferrales bacterium]|nr:c-type cytochrome [Candidatus Acidoferrales bacterium]
MELSGLQKTMVALVAIFGAVLRVAWLAPRHTPEDSAVAQEIKGCPTSDAGLKLPAGFCATVFADGIGHARHMVMAPNGALYVNTWSGTYYGNEKPHEGGFLVALKDTTGSGKADVVERFGGTAATGDHGGVGIGYYNGSIFAETNDRIVSYKMNEGSIVPTGPEVTVVSGLPLTGDHPMHPFIITAHGDLLVDVATATNACQERNRRPGSPGRNPCTELETRGGTWKFDANNTGQKFSPAERYATGIRNGEGFAIDGEGRIFVTQHGRDQLHSNWPQLYKPEEEATLPAEEVVALKQGGDYGWPECYYDPFAKSLVLAPEYGGDGKGKVGVCTDKLEPAAAFPAHWAPNDLVHYNKTEFPSRYRSGLFVAFHGSWNRAPFPQGGYNVVYQPMEGEHAAGRCEIFADGFAGSVKTPDGAAHRPSGLAVGNDGALFISDDVRGRIYRVTYVGSHANPTGHITLCPSLTAPAGEIARTEARPPEGTHEEAGATAKGKVALPKGVTPAMVALGKKVFRGEVGGASCTSCHGMTGAGGPLGPPLNKKTWIWSNGSYEGILKTITDGVANPKKYRAPMPPKGGAQLTEGQVKGVAAYVWSLSHEK